ncbi:hypothetical protein [Mycobacterium sp.]|jgi:hypothetical protein|nr:hypothetical protein [Mycobacterium sp.]HZA08654.1 hypothetical protein [Mycobacterium sp.]
MTMSTLLRAEAVGRLMDIQDVCNRVFTGTAKYAFADEVAQEIIEIIKRP